MPEWTDPPRHTLKFQPLAENPTTSLLSFGRDLCGDWTLSSRREWLVTNGIGGFACGTVAQANTRRYHGLLVASLAPPVDRVLLLSKLDMAVTYHGDRYELTANEFADGTISPRGFVHIQSFELIDGVPTWTYACADALLQQQIFMAPGANTTYVRLTLLRAAAPMQIDLTPLCACRDYHSHQRGSRDVSVNAGERDCSLRIGADGTRTQLSMDRGNFVAGADWYWNFHHRMEAERGLDAVEDLLMPGRFGAGLQIGESCVFSVSCEAGPPPPPDEVLNQLAERCGRLRRVLPADAPEWIRQLALASDQFIVRRGAATAPGATAPGASIIAGYPWFADWSRDALISLPGLTLTLGRHDIAAGILDTLMSFADRGMLPNRFCDHGEALEFNTADATLWLFNAADEYVAATADLAWARRTLPILTRIVLAHVEGTRFGIRVDDADGLLRAGEPGLQLTWMDAKVGDWVVTPRIGKPVEINALWLNALDVLLRLAIRLRDTQVQTLSKSLLARARAGFGRFWNESADCLYDVIDVEGGPHHDASVRPNQIFAASLPYCALTMAQTRAVVDICARELLTSVGLRSLSPRDPAYQGNYGGDQRRRDGAYHQGTVWSWLIGPFAWAHFRAYGNAGSSRSFLDPIGAHLRDACIGSVSEIFDGDPPHEPQGCFAQAWGVAETLRVWLRLDREIKRTKDG